MGEPDGTDDARPEPAVELVEPARQQLVALADDVLGRLAAEDVPASLRPFARFAPAKRRRLAAAALAAALDADDAFRERVADAVATATPELVTAVREGADTAASDPADVAVVAYLTRPDGWRGVLAGAAARWRDERAVDSGDADELAALRDEVARLRRAARGEAARLRQAADDAVADVRDELASLRRTVRDRTRELRAAERERDAALAAARDAADAVEQAVRARVDELEAARAAQLQNLQERTEAAERVAAAVRRGARTERDVDDARLWLLVDTLVQAASGVRRELSLAPPAMRPADAVGATSAADVAGDGRSVSDPAALDAVLSLPHAHLIVDGYNVTKTGYPELALADQRARLTGALAALAARTGAEVTVAFDGAARPPVQPPAPRGVRVLFSAADEIADDLIRRLVAAEPPGRAVLVVTSDRQIVRDTARAGVWSAPAATLLARL